MEMVLQSLQEAEMQQENSNMRQNALRSVLIFPSQFHFQCFHSQEANVVSWEQAISMERVQFHSSHNGTITTRWKEDSEAAQKLQTNFPTMK